MYNMDNNKLLTIVVPSYNASKYLDCNLRSFLTPSVPKNLEVIVVNDGSTDDTAQIVDAYHEKYPETIRVIHKENGGHGSGINAGLRAAKGKYFKVVDADDWVDHEALEKLLRYIESFHCAYDDHADSPLIPDVIYNNYYWRLTDETKVTDDYERKAEFTEPFSGVEYHKVYEFESIADQCYVKMHNMTVRTALLRENHIHIDEHHYYVDMEYILYPMPFVQTIAFLPDYLYQYQIGRSGQSMDPAKLRKNAAQYDFVLESIFNYYDSCCRIMTQPNKKKYIDRLIARFYAGRVKILLSMDEHENRKKELLEMEERLKQDFTAIYKANINPAIKALRLSRYSIYSVAAWAVKHKMDR